MADDLIELIQKRARVWAGQITRKANSTPGKPAHIRVKSTVFNRPDGVDMVSYGISPLGDARAYEKGSGIHSQSGRRSRWQEGSRGPILITPKRASVLAFFWEKVDESTPTGKKFRGISSQGKAIFNYVEHPGVEAANGGRGYLAPAIAEVRKTIRKEVPQEVRKAVVGEIRKAFKRK